jgi:hypothetical protein
MTWKTYAAVSGATVLAGWIASSPPANAPATSASGQRRGAPAANRAPAGSDIEEQAARLQARLRQETEYQAPARNPFRFGSREVTRSATSERTEAPAPVEPVLPALPPPPPIRLSGIAEDGPADRIERTAVLSVPAGVLLVREGDVVLGQYRVARIEAGAVELTDASGGPAVRLTLRP